MYVSMKRVNLYVPLLYKQIIAKQNRSVLIKHNIDVNKDGRPWHEPKKSNCLSAEQVDQFLNEAQVIYTTGQK